MGTFRAVTESVSIDSVGLETLEVMQNAQRYNAWQYGRIAPYLGARICEIGSGIGNMSELLVTAPRDLVVLTDRQPHYLEMLRQKFAAGRLPVVVQQLDLPDPTATERFQQFALDTVVALNVVEHIEDDLAALRTIRALLQPGGRFVMLVPAFSALYGTLDLELGHFRRYTRSLVMTRLSEAGFHAERVFYFNFVGGLGWWLNARVLRRSQIAARQVRCFEALVPLLRLEDRFRLPFGQSVISVATRA
jgi:SAM-dependent methyltransferase